MKFVPDTNIYESLRRMFTEECIVSRHEEGELASRGLSRLNRELGCDSISIRHDESCFQRLSKLDIERKVVKNRHRFSSRDVENIKQYLDRQDYFPAWEILRRTLNIKENWNSRRGNVITDCSNLKLAKDKHLTLITKDQALLDLCKEELGPKRCTMELII